MNKDQLIGALKELSGNAQEDFGTLIGSASQQEKGFDLQSADRAQVCQLIASLVTCMQGLARSSSVL
jgi:hypothetical protein